MLNAAAFTAALLCYSTSCLYPVPGGISSWPCQGCKALTFPSPSCLEVQAALEVLACRVLGVHVPLLLRVGITMALLLSTGHYFFWATLKQYGVLEVAVASVANNVGLLSAALGSPAAAS